MSGNNSKSSDTERYVIGASVKGASHIRKKVECQDSMRKVELDDGSIIIAVADGHGSDACPYSKSGSNIAVNTFCRIVNDLHDSYIDNPFALQTYLNREGEVNFAQAVEREWKKRVLRAHTNAKRDTPYLPTGEKDAVSIYKQYGTTLLGVYLTKTYVFSFQLGDGDILIITQTGGDPLIEADKMLGVETHSLCKSGAWKSVKTSVNAFDKTEYPIMLSISTDGLSNSFVNEVEFIKNCHGYYNLIREHGADSIAPLLHRWLTETSSQGCGDDITAVFVHIVS